MTEAFILVEEKLPVEFSMVAVLMPGVCCVSGDGWAERRYVQLLQDADASGSYRSQEAHGEGAADRGDHAAR